MVDRLTLTRAFEEAGVKSDSAEKIATEIYDAIRENVATKADLRDLEQRLDARFASLDVRFARMEHQITRMTISLAVFVTAVAGLAGTLVHFWR
jgi:2-phosphoglycerate kinase